MGPGAPAGPSGGAEPRGKTGKSARARGREPPVASGVDLQYPVNAAGRLVEPQQFGDIVLRAQPDGSLLRVRDLGRVELGAQDYKTFSRFDKKPASVVLVYLSPGANAVDTADRVRTLLDDAQARFPEGL